MVLLALTTSQTKPVMVNYKQRVEQALVVALPYLAAPTTPLQHAMSYALLNGGKRLRPSLIYATGEALNVDLARLDSAACAVELIHAYSLVHDDLPAMDNDDWRRGQATCHRAFDEATAILAGDALQAAAFSCLSAPHSVLSAEQRLQMLHKLAEASGVKGMAGGQALDLAATPSIGMDQLQTIHALKTGALIQVCVELACIAGQASAKITNTLLQFASQFGLAFQIHNDMLDVVGNLQAAGKHAGGDAKNNKVTYPTFLGLAQTQAQLVLLQQKCLNLLVSLPNTQALQQLAQHSLHVYAPTL